MSRCVSESAVLSGILSHGYRSGDVGSWFCLLFVPNTLLVAFGWKTTRFQRFGDKNYRKQPNNKKTPKSIANFCQFRFLHFAEIAHFWWRMVCSQVICDQLEVCYAKKDLRNELFRRFCVDPCVFYLFLKRISMSESLSQKNLNRIEANQGFGSRFAWAAL